jgi:thiaminase
MVSFFERLRTEASAEWRAYTEHPFTNGLADGSLAEAAFRHYLAQDYSTRASSLPSGTQPSAKASLKASGAGQAEISESDRRAAERLFVT